VLASWKDRIERPGWERQVFRHVHTGFALAGLWWLDPSAWPLYLLLLALVAVERPFYLQLANGVQLYLPVTWVIAAGAYLAGPATMPVFWIAALFGFGMIILLDSTGLVTAHGIALESARRFRGQPYDLEVCVDGELQHTVVMIETAVRLVVIAAARALDLALPVIVLAAEGAVALMRWTIDFPGRSSPSRKRAWMARSLGRGMPVVMTLLDAFIVTFLLLAYREGGGLGFAAASLSTLTLHFIMKRMNDLRIESEARRQALVEMRAVLDQRQRLAAIGETASTVFHQIGRHHGAIGMYAHLLSRGPNGDGAEAWTHAAVEHAARITRSVEEANRVVDQLLRFGQDRTLSPYRHVVGEMLAECVVECQARATARAVTISVGGTVDESVILDKHKVKQAIGNLLDNAIDASAPGGRVEVAAARNQSGLCISVRDHGDGVAREIHDRLFTPFCTTKPDGVGLGLALAKELVEAHGGTLEWTPAEPGATFVVTLPNEPAERASD
jgi:signal transduction histidine kinase